mmetsp:Transcript_13235/g.34960  ORF Transcript_13235/g.34960 Transcript_13235/m.34960 type:complete len:234 (-) Transcript_13235:97-798(-)
MASHHVEQRRGGAAAGPRGAGGRGLRGAGQKGLRPLGARPRRPRGRQLRGHGRPVPGKGREELRPDLHQRRPRPRDDLARFPLDLQELLQDRLVQDRDLLLRFLDTFLRLLDLGGAHGLHDGLATAPAADGHDLLAARSQRLAQVLPLPELLAEAVVDHDLLVDDVEDLLSEAPLHAVAGAAGRRRRGGRRRLPEGARRVGAARERLPGGVGDEAFQTLRQWFRGDPCLTLRA